ncbi:MAG: bifunctional oligoribonuclease/PAP phosphatase NrnA [bacterium]
MKEPVYSRTQLDLLLKTLKQFKKVLILTHSNPDPDAIASAFALKYLISHLTSCKARVVYSGVIGRRENKAMIRELSLNMVQVDEIHWKAYDGLVLIDHQPGRRYYPWPENRWPDIVIDHHPRRPLAKAVKFIDVRTEFGSSSSLVASYLLAANLPIPRWLSSALIYGITTDTQEFSRSRIERDKKIYISLFENADHLKIYRFSHPLYHSDYLSEYWYALKSAYIYKDIVISFMGLVTVPDGTAEVADNLINMHGIRYAVATGYFADTLYMSLRVRNVRRDAGKILRLIVGKKGSAGGHGFMAGAQIKEISSFEEAEQLAQNLHNKIIKLLHPDFLLEQAKPVLYRKDIRGVGQ